MTTAANKDHPEIIWGDLKTELLDKDPEEREENYVAEGHDIFGNEYAGTAQFICGELEAIKDIEII
jgi:hypothetical protein